MKKQNLKSLKLNKNSVSNFSSISGGFAAASGVDCVTQVGSCQTTSCVCTNNQHCLTWTCPVK